MGDFKRSSGGSRGGFGGGRGGFGGDRGGRSSFGARKSFGGGDRGPVTMHKATCSECNETCEVPFRPTGEKPVYCSKCFGDRGGSAGQDRGGRRDFGRREET
ncbi:MAG: CxxC-x17-CxxC domain-containing protein, partial [bacterium]